MTITSKQKKTLIPLAVLIVSTTYFVWNLGSITVLFALPFMAFSVGIMGATVGPVIGAWFSRDGWK